MIHRLWRCLRRALRRPQEMTFDPTDDPIIAEWKDEGKAAIRSAVDIKQMAERQRRQWDSMADAIADAIADSRPPRKRPPRKRSV